MSDLETLLSTTRTLFDSCHVPLKGGAAYLSTPASGHMPWILTREQALLTAGLTALGDVNSARPLLRTMLALQRSNGRWDVGYSSDGEAKDGPGIIESTAIVAWAMLLYADLADDQKFAKAVEPRLRRTLDGLIELLHPQAHLPLVDADLLPGSYSVGYSLWTASIAGAALMLAGEVYRERDYDEAYDVLRHTIEANLVYDGHFIARLARNGQPDLRPAITAIAPILFGLWDTDDELAMDTVRWLSTTLLDRRIKGYMPFITFAPGKHGGLPGVWPLATAWLARILHEQGEREEADRLLRWQLGSMVQGHLPRTIVTPKGLDIIERHRDTFVQHARESWPAETVRAVLSELERQREERSLLYAFSPHLLTHLETIRAFRAGGYVETFSLTAE